MTWLWGVALILLCVLMYGLGVIGARLFIKPYGKNRRVADRRSGVDRRSTQSPDQAAAHAHERRSGDRRTGVDRRRPPSPIPAMSAVVSAMILATVTAVAYAGPGVTSFFGADQPNLIGSGWADCDTPITWSIDTSRMSADQAAKVKAQMERDFKKWSTASGLDFQFVGEVPIKYNDTTFAISSEKVPSARHIYVAFLRNDQSSLLDARTVGFAQPSKVFADRKEIVEGSVVLSIDYVLDASKREFSTLTLHELGHALGLGHAEEEGAVMYPILGGQRELSAADISGIKALTKVCPAAG